MLVGREIGKTEEAAGWTLDPGMRAWSLALAWSYFRNLGCYKTFPCLHVVTMLDVIEPEAFAASMQLIPRYVFQKSSLIKTGQEWEDQVFVLTSHWPSGHASLETLHQPHLIRNYWDKIDLLTHWWKSCLSNQNNNICERDSPGPLWPLSHPHLSLSPAATCSHSIDLYLK